MHEYHEAIHIIEHAIEEAKQKGYHKVTKINLVIGESSGYSGDSIRMHYEDAAQGHHLRRCRDLRPPSQNHAALPQVPRAVCA